PTVSGAEFSFCTLESFNTTSLMMYSCSAVSLRRGAGATAGGAFVCACTFSPDAHKAIDHATAAATATKLELRSGNGIERLATDEIRRSSRGENLLKAPSVPSSRTVQSEVRPTAANFAKSLAKNLVIRGTRR